MTDIKIIDGEEYIKKSAVKNYLEEHREKRINVDDMAYEDNVNIDEVIEDLGL